MSFIDFSVIFVFITNHSRLVNSDWKILSVKMRNTFRVLEVNDDGVLLHVSFAFNVLMVQTAK
jgi:hypothetical protein